MDERTQIRQMTAVCDMHTRLSVGATAEQVYEAAMDALVRGLDVQRCSILLFDVAGKVHFVASRGLSDAYRSAASGHCPWRSEQVDAAPFAIPDVLASDVPSPLREAIVHEGIRALAFIPLPGRHRLLGKFMLYADSPREFTADELSLALMVSKAIGNALERQAAEVALAAAEARTRTLIQDLKEVVFHTDAQGRWTFLNRAWEEITGYAVADSIGRVFLDFVHPDDCAHSVVKFGQLIEGSVDHCEQLVRYTTRAGGFRWIEVRAQLTRDDHQRPIGASGTLTDVSERVTAVDALRRSQERLEYALQGSQDGFWDWQIATGDLFLSASLRAMMAIPAELTRFNIADWSAFIHPADAARVEQHVQEHLSGQTPAYAFEYRMRRRSGEWRWFLNRGKVVQRSATGAPLRVAGTMTDVHERRLVQQALEEEHQLFNGGRNILYRARVADFGIEYVSRNIEQLGYTAEYATSGQVSILDFIHPDDKDRAVGEAVAAIAAKAPVLEHTYRLRAADGAWRTFYDYGRLLRDDQDEVTHFHGYLLDITRELATTDALHIAQERMSFAVNAADAWVVDWKRDEGAPWYSRDLFNALGTPPGHAPQTFQAFVATVAPDDRDRVRDVIYPRTPGQRDFDLEFRIQATADAPLRWLWARGKLFRDEKGRLQRGLAVLLDVTHRKRDEAERMSLQEQLVNTQKLESLGVLAGGIAHDFNNLLMGVLGNASLAREITSPDHPVQELLVDITGAARRAVHLTQQMLAFGGRGRFVVDTVQLAQVAADLGRQLIGGLPGQARFSLDISPHTPAIEADASQIRQAITNLVTNAADALGPAGGQIRLRTGAVALTEDDLRAARYAHEARPGEFAYIEVEDDGHGMDADTLNHIFEPFFSTRFAGRGLGLPAVMGIVRAHHGALFVDTTIGHGSRLRMALPVASASRRPTPAPPVPAAPGPRSRVLVVDDEPMVLTVASRVLKSAGYDVVTTERGATAVDLARQPPGFDVILLDLTMPDMNGEQTVQALRAAGVRTPVLLSSGYNESEADRIAGVDGHAFIQKPYTVDALRKAVRAVLDHAISA